MKGYPLVRDYRLIGFGRLVAWRDTSDSPNYHRQRNAGDYHFRSQQAECYSQMPKDWLLPVTRPRRPEHTADA